MAFGDGVAFAVGVKLSQNAAHKVVVPHPSPAGLSDRLSQVEESVKRIERTPAGIPPGAGPKTGLDQKVLEAIVNALEARLKEHAGLVERRLADLDAKIAIELKSLDQQDHAIAGKVTQDLNTLEGQMISVHREFGEAVAKIVAEQVASQVQTHAAAWERSLEGRIADGLDQGISRIVSSRLEPLERQLGEEAARRDREIAELRTRLTEADAEVERRLAALVAACLEPLERQLREEAARRDREIAELRMRLTDADTEVERRLAALVAVRLEPLELQLREEISRKDREIAEFRQYLADADAGMLEMVTGIGQIYRLAAERIARTATAQAGAHGPVAIPVPPEAVQAESIVPEEGNSTAPAQPVPEPAPEPTAETPLPGFAQLQKPTRLWRIPLVSSFVILATGCLILARYL